jgi:hypothetical protein
MKTVLPVAALLTLPFFGFAQSTTSDILGTVYDASGAVVADSKVTIRSLETNQSRETSTSSDGTFRFRLLPVGSYEVTVEKTGFARYIQQPIALRLNQAAELRINLEVSGTAETISVTADAPLINTTNAEISTNFDSKRIEELPLAVNRNVSNIVLSVPGVSQLSSGQSNFAQSGNIGTESTGSSYAANGMRTRSNNFMIDGQDANDASVGGLQQPINNPDIIGEIRVITNQFAPEYGRAAGSVVNVITKSGTNALHGSLFWFHNSNSLNSRSNLDKAARFSEAPFRIENQFGGTVGGPVIKNRTFFFAGVQRWTDRRLGSGSTINGAPTEEGRRILQQAAGTLPTVQALLENLPAGTPNGQSRSITVGGQSYTIPLGNLTGATSQRFDNWQWIGRGDHRFNDKHTLGGRYMDDDTVQSGTGQATPVGLSNVNPVRARAVNLSFNSSFSPNVLNELRPGYNRYETVTNAQNPEVAERIPSLEIPDLNLRGFNAAASRTAIGLGVNLPQYATRNNYQLADTLSIVSGSHSMKFGIDFRRQEQFQFFNPTIRGRLEYATLQRLVDDQATVAQINAPLPGAERLQYYRYYDYFFFLQDEWRVTPNFTLTYGVRYESPGNPIANLAEFNERVVAAAGGDERYRLTPVPPRDTNNWAPRLGFNYRFGQGPGVLSWLTGASELVMRGGYSRTYDIGFNNIALNVGSAFPFVLVYDVPLVAATSTRNNAFTQIAAIRSGFIPPISNPNLITRTVVGADFRSPLAEQFALQLQRQLTGNWAISAGYVGTKGTALFQTVDGNPTVPGSGGTQRVDPTRGVIRERCNCTSSTYHSLQTSLEKRLSQNFSMAAHYTWSAFIDGASEIFNPSVSGEIAVPQDAFNRDGDRGRSTYDRPHRFTMNGVFELPFWREQSGFLGLILGGWQVNTFVTVQSGAPFSPLNGSDPGARAQGISGLVGNPIRPNLNTNLDLSSMSLREIQRAGGSALFTPVTAANPIGNVGRNILRSDGIRRTDLGVFKNFRIHEGHQLQFQANFFNLTNTRNYGIPDSAITSAGFLNEGATDGGNRRIQMGLRYSF